jgi:hypothetical protein
MKNFTSMQIFFVMSQVRNVESYDVELIQFDLKLSKRQQVAYSV